MSVESSQGFEQQPTDAPEPSPAAAAQESVGTTAAETPVQEGQEEGAAERSPRPDAEQAARQSPVENRNRDFMRGLREAGGIPIGLPVWPGVAELGAVFLRTDVELMRKSRRVVPQKLLDAGYRFAAPTWEEAAPELVRRWRTQRDRGVEAEAALAG